MSGVKRLLEDRCMQCNHDCPDTSYNKSIVHELSDDDFQILQALGLTCEEVLGCTETLTYDEDYMKENF